MSSIHANRDPWRSGETTTAADAKLSDGRIPTPRTSFVGREEALFAIRSLILDEEIRLVTLVGTGGSGKTRIAIEVAKSASDSFDLGGRFIPLAARRQPQLVVDAIAIGMSVARAEGADPFAAIVDSLGSQTILLILDNMEHLLEATIDVGRLLDTCPGLTVLATSRKPLNMSGERLYRVGPLSLPASDSPMDLAEVFASEAGKLFIERARLVNDDHAFSDTDAPTIAGICTKLDGLPLAIELATPRMRILTLTSLLAQLDARLPLLNQGPIDAPVRHQTLREAIAWSYDLLNNHQQRCFRRMSICVGGFTLEAAEAIGNSDPHDSCLESGETLDHVSILLDSSLIDRSAENQDEPRFTFLETIREFGLEQLRLNGELEEVSRLHSVYYQQLAQRTRPLIEGRDGPMALNVFESEHANIRKALKWFLDKEDVPHAVRLTRDLWKFWWVRQHVAEARSWMAQTLALAGDDESEGVVEILYGAGVTALSQGDIDEATRCVDRGLSTARKNNDHDWSAAHHILLAHIEDHNGNLERARVALEKGIVLSRLNDPPGSIGEHRTAMLNALAVTLHELGDDEGALGLAEESHSIFDRRGDHWGLARAMSTIAEVASAAGDFQRAIPDKQECVRLFHETGDPRATALAIGDLAGLAARTGQPSTAIRLFGAVESIRQQTNGDELSVARPGYLALIQAARAAVGERFADLAWNEGRELTLGQAVQEALALSMPRSGQSGRNQRTGQPVLTRRELDVLRLVATGATDQQIADSLFIASRAVTTHVTSILGKLNVENRTAAAALATRTGLV